MDPRVLSLQSHVVHGYVGNKSATFPLQLHGLDVDAINSVQLATHTHYRVIKGQRLGKEEIDTLVDGLRANGLLGCYSHVLTGYVASPAFLAAIADLVLELRAEHASGASEGGAAGGGASAAPAGAAPVPARPTPFYVCDPVLGDGGKFYVPQEVVPVYKERILPLASLLTPNQFEAEVLTGISISDLPSAGAALDALHAAGARAIVITSSTLTAAHLAGASGAAGEEDDMLLLGSCPWDDVADELGPGGVFAAAGALPAASRPAHARFAIRVPRIRGPGGGHLGFTGTGDLTAALLLAHSQRLPGSLPRVCQLTLASLQAVCRRTAAHYAGRVAELEHARSVLAAHEAGDASALAAASAAAGGMSAEAARRVVKTMLSAKDRPADYVPPPDREDAINAAYIELRVVQSREDLMHPEALPGLEALRALPLSV